MKTEPDAVFCAAGIHDPFVKGNPYLIALLDLSPRERRIIARQAVALCAAVADLEPLGALELLARVAPFLEVNCC